MTVSIIIPCYNAADFVAESVKSAFDQSHRPLQVICVDNNSTDDTLAVLHSLGEQYPELVVIEEKTPGAPAARNAGLNVATGEWIQFLDADDLLAPDKITAQLDSISGYGEIPFVAAAYERLDLSSGSREVIELLRPEWQGLLNNRLGITSANLFRREALLAVGGFDIALKSSQEYDLMFRLMKAHGHPGLDDTPLTTIRSRSEGSISAADVKGNQHRYLALTARICVYLKSSEAEVYSTLSDQWFQDMFIRIRMNAIDGYPKSPDFFKAIMPSDFVPEARPFTPTWFRLLMGVFGYGMAERLRSVIKG